MIWLKSLKECPPGQFKYEQTEGLHQRFDGTPLIGELARSVADFRKGNQLPRASQNECLEDIILFTVARLGGDLQWCFETSLSAAELLPQSIAGGCGGCGAAVS